MCQQGRVRDIMVKRMLRDEGTLVYVPPQESSEGTREPRVPFAENLCTLLAPCVPEHKSK